MPNRNNKVINLALQGGGSHGAFTWGVLDRLLVDGRLHINSISGVSSGAMNAVVMAYGMLDGGPAGARELLRAFWEKVSVKFTELFYKTPGDYWEMFPGFEKPAALEAYLSLAKTFSPCQLNPFNLNPLRDLLVEHVDFERLRRKSPVKLYIGATQVRTGKLRVFTNSELSEDVLLAFACLPSLHRPIDIDGEYYWDGGYSGNPPLFPLIFNSKHPDIVVVLLQPLRREQVPYTADEISRRRHELSFSNTFLREMRAIALSKEEIKLKGLFSGNLEKKIGRLKVHIIEDMEIARMGFTSRFNADEQFIQTLYRQGVGAAEDWLPENYPAITKVSTIDLAEMFC